MTREELLGEAVKDKFMRYVKIDTESKQEGPSCPSTKGQLELAHMLLEEIRTVGLQDARIDRYGIVYAAIPGKRQQAPAVGFLAHMDTVPGVPGRNVRPVLHERYGGGDLVLPDGSVIHPADQPELSKLIGHDLITSDGRTLLGADDKAGVAEIMTMLCRLVQHPETPHGPVKVAFTPDEETGGGIGHFDTNAFSARCAYTVDGGEAGVYEEENFNAENQKITIYGVSSHTGTARGRMVNAVSVASELVTSVPAGMRPDTTDGRLGFLHPDRIEGNVEQVTMRWLLRDFSDEGLENKRRLIRSSLRLLAAKYPGLRTKTTVTGGYKNMKAGIEKDHRISAFALEAIKRAGMTPVTRPIRGGTDGARLTQMGLPTPNLFTGGLNFHSRKELVSVQWVEKSVETLLHLVELWAGA